MDIKSRHFMIQGKIYAAWQPPNSGKCFQSEKDQRTQRDQFSDCPIRRSVGMFGCVLSNGHSPANLLNSSTRQKFAIFGEFEYSPKWSFLKIGRTRYIHRHSPTCFGRTRYIHRNSPTCFGRTRYIRRHSPTYFAWTRYIRRIRRIRRMYRVFRVCRV